MSNGPCSAMAACTAGVSVMSSRITPSDGWMSNATTSAPSFANRAAVAAPIPEDAPVTSTFLSANRIASDPCHVVGDVPEVVEEELPRREVPRPVGGGEGVPVSPVGDGLEPRADLLEHDEARVAHGGAVLVQLDHRVAGGVPRPRRAVVVPADHAAPQRRCRLGALRRD